MKKFSVILTTYNSEKFIEKTLQSILNQDQLGSLFELELLVVDDCSTDETKNILNRLGVTALSTPKNTGGPNAGRNIGLKNASGDFICIADHDDIWHSNRLVSIIPFVDKSEIITSGFTLKDTVSGQTINRVLESEKGYLIFEKNRTFLNKLSKTKGGQHTYLGCIFFSKNLLHNSFEEEFGVVDFDWVLRLFIDQPSLEVCDSLYTRFVDGPNLSLDPKYREIDYNFSLKTIKKYQSEFPEAVKIAEKRINGSKARYHYLMGEMKKARHYLLKSEFSGKTILYYLTSFIGHKWVRKKFNIFG